MISAEAQICRCVAGDKFVREATPFVAVRLGFREEEEEEVLRQVRERCRGNSSLARSGRRGARRGDGGGRRRHKGTIQVIQVRKQVFAIRTVDRKEVQDSRSSDHFYRFSFRYYLIDILKRDKRESLKLKNKVFESTGKVFGRRTPSRGFRKLLTENVILVSDEIIPLSCLSENSRIIKQGISKGEGANRTGIEEEGRNCVDGLRKKNLEWEGLMAFPMAPLLYRCTMQVIYYTRYYTVHYVLLIVDRIDERETGDKDLRICKCRSEEDLQWNIKM
ncbi:hypothetical protein V1478_006759 [Vespula squamosa]|uniref:Uncharacterized protein n=1 Tax=Vespula squamosa TaxID=30214 RepID=A0ABD2B0T4_VESSQ